MAKKTTGTAEVKVRMPKDLHRKIQRDADRQGQTINAEILRRLQSSYQSDRMFEGVLAPDNAKLIRMLGLATVLAGAWKKDHKRAYALRFAIERIFLTFAEAPELHAITQARERLKERRDTVGSWLRESMLNGDAISQVVLNNEAPRLTARPDIRADGTEVDFDDDEYLELDPDTDTLKVIQRATDEDKTGGDEK